MITEAQKKHIEGLLPHIPAHVEVIVIESNITTKEDVDFVLKLQEQDSRVTAMLIGGVFIAAESVHGKIKELMAG